jgi:hypothetical protein
MNMGVRTSGSAPYVAGTIGDLSNFIGDIQL